MIVPETVGIVRCCHILQLLHMLVHHIPKHFYRICEITKHGKKTYEQHPLKQLYFILDETVIHVT